MIGGSTELACYASAALLLIAVPVVSLFFGALVADWLQVGRYRERERAEEELLRKHREVCKMWTKTTPAVVSSAGVLRCIWCGVRL